MDSNQDLIKHRLSSTIAKSDKTYKDLAEILDISYTTFVSYAKGVSIPKQDTLQKIASYFGTTVGFIMGYEEEKKLSLDELKIKVKDFGLQDLGTVDLFKPVNTLIDLVEILHDKGSQNDLAFFNKFQNAFAGFLMECLDGFEPSEHEKVIDPQFSNTAALFLHDMNRLAYEYIALKKK